METRPLWLPLTNSWPFWQIRTMPVWTTIPPLAVFDVSASNALLEQMREEDTLDVTLELNGINEDSDLIALHFTGNLEDCDAAMEGVNADFANTTVDFAVEVLDVTVENGKAAITLSSFSPVMLMTRVEVASAAQPSQQPVETQNPAVSQTDGDNHLLFWGVLGVVAVVAVIGLVVATNKKTAVKK